MLLAQLYFKKPTMSNYSVYILKNCQFVQKMHIYLLCAKFANMIKIKFFLNLMGV